MNVMQLAHFNTRKALAKAENAGRKMSYREVFVTCLRAAHIALRKALAAAAKLAAKYLVPRFIKPGQYEPTDIRTLPVFSASNDVLTGFVDNWTIKGTSRTFEGTSTENVSGFHQSSLTANLKYWAQHGTEYAELCLMLEIDGKLYRLIK